MAEHVEIESGRKNSRPQLQAAITHAKQVGAVLLVAKLDRLARNVAFLAHTDGKPRALQSRRPAGGR
ncbi:recombinase family protein [Hymenobacter sp. AT01-02]|uniref:recombinase family protein n=1 Tax=Hymenobacter sp. AT01-02 TaxID=1571877 RepID=UPI0006E2C8F6|nr:recombinase family protein [Hymenobacter sp. AT01-02]